MLVLGIIAGVLVVAVMRNPVRLSGLERKGQIRNELRIRRLIQKAQLRNSYRRCGE